MAVVSSRLVFLSAICLLIAPAIVRPQPQDLNYNCSDMQGNYSSGSTYEANLNHVLSPLSSNSTDIDYGFYNSSYGEDPDKVYAIGLCRGDLEPDVCRNCFSFSKDNLTTTRFCPDQKEAIVWYEECMLRYSSRNIFSTMDDTPEHLWKSDWNVSDYSDAEKVEFNKDLSNLLQNLSGQAAAGGSLRKFAVGNASAPRYQTLYGLMQCTPDLSEQDCGRCLNGAIDNFLKSNYSQRLGARIRRPSCNFRFENSSFFGPTAYAPPPTATLLPPPPTLQPLTPPSPPSPPPAEANNAHKVVNQILFGLALMIMEHGL